MFQPSPFNHTGRRRVARGRSVFFQPIAGGGGGGGGGAGGGAGALGGAGAGGGREGKKRRELVNTPPVRSGSRRSKKRQLAEKDENKNLSRGWDARTGRCMS